MTPAVRDLVIHFLEDLRGRMGNAGCNDFHWPPFMTSEDIAEIWQLVSSLNDEFSDHEPPDVTYDWLVVSTLVNELGG